jgi:hypothetical protein
MLKRVGFALALVLVLAGAAQAVSYITFEQITVTNTAIGFTTAKITPNPAGGVQPNIAVCRLRTAEISYTIDGTTPTSSVGMLLEVGDVLTVVGHDNMARFLAIRTTASSGQLDCTYTAP